MARPKPRKPGEVVGEFDVRGRDGRKHHVVFRYPRMADFEQLLKFINAAVKETAFLRLNKPVPRGEERTWLRNTMGGIRKGTKVYVAAEIDGAVSGGASVDRSFGRCSHRGEIGIVLREMHSNMGIGSRLMESAMREAARIGVEIVTLSHAEDNARAKHVYEKLGFARIGVLPKAMKDGKKYRDEVIMYRMVKKL